MVRVSSGSSMRASATVRKYGGRKTTSVGRVSISKRADYGSQTRREEPKRGVRTNPRANNQIVSRQRSTGGLGRLSNKSKTVYERKKDVYVKPKGKYVTSNPAPYGRDKDGVPKVNSESYVKLKSGDVVGRKATKGVSKVTKVTRKTRGSVGAIKRSGIKTIKFKSIKAGKPKGSKVGKGLTTLSKTRRKPKPKTVTKMGPHGTVKSRKVVGGPRRKVSKYGGLVI